jgi:CRISP-associated protein Cas1
MLSPYQNYQNGQQFRLTLVLAGEMIHFAQAFAEAFLHFEKVGIGFSDDGKPGRVELMDVTAGHGASWHPNDGFDIPFPHFKTGTLRKISHVLLIPQSPFRISYEGSKDVLGSGQLSSALIFRSLWQRIAYINQEYDLNVPLQPDAMPESLANIGLKVHPDRFYDTKRFETAKWNLQGGLKNILEFKGELTQALPLLILGSKLGLGDQCSFGLGSYKLAILDYSNFTEDQAKRAISLSKSQKNGLYDRERLHFSEIRELCQAVQNKKYNPLPLQKFKIGNREIAAPALRDRIVQRWVNDYLVSFFDDTLSSTAYGYRAGYSAAKAVKRVMHEVKHGGYRYGINLDIKNYFDSIDRHRLFWLLNELPINQNLIQLIYKWVENGGFRFGMQWEETESGIGQGNVISPILSNLYLAHFDALMAQIENVLMIRYSDDFVILGKSPEVLSQAVVVAEKFLQRIGNLKIHEGAEIKDLRQDLLSFMGISLNEAGARIDPERREEKTTKLLSKAGEAKDEENALLNIQQYLQRLGAYYGQVLEAGWAAEKIRILEDSLKQKPKTYILKAIENALRNIKAIYSVKEDEGAEPNLKRSRRELEQEKRRAIQEAALERTIIVDQPYSILRLRKGTLFIENQKGNRNFAIRKLQYVFITASNSVRITTPIILELARRGVHLVLLDSHGEPAAWLSGRQRISAPDFIAQHEFRNSLLGAELARKIIYAKCRNQLNLVKYWNKSRDKAFDLDLGKMAALMKELKALNPEKCDDWRQSLMLTEAAVAAHYWNVVKSVLVKYDFPGRKRKGADDPINSALNYGYGMLLSHVNMAILKSGLIAEMGLLHADQYGKPTLAYDIMELFRQPFIDRTIISLAAKGAPIIIENKRLSDDSRRYLIRNVMKALNFPEEYLGQSIPRITIIERQVLEIQKDIRKNSDNFKAYYLSKW